jgi:hypothetical protein
MATWILTGSLENFRINLEHVQVADHRHLAFQGQLRQVSDADAELIRERLGAAADVRG